MSSLPKYLYKYQPFSTQSLENLKKQQIYFCAPIDFNDPFDCAINLFTDKLTETERHCFEQYLHSENGPQGVDELFENGILRPEFREKVLEILFSIFDNWVEEKRSEWGVACFSAKKNDVLMWSYYAHGHRGYCLEFDTNYDPFSSARKVSYEIEIPKIKPTAILQNSDSESFWKMILTKHSNWKHEEEWRMMHVESRILYGYPKESLTGVYFGSEMAFTHMEIICLILKGQNPSVKFYRCDRLKDSFELGIRSVEYKTFIEHNKEL